MKSFWALPAALRLALALERPFSVQNDLLAFPQYDVVFSESFVPAEDAAKQLETFSTQHDDSSSLSERQHELANSQVLAQHVLGDSPQPQLDPRDIYERMMLNGTSYLCRIPYVAPEVPGSSNASAINQAELQQELIRASDHGWELLSTLEGNCLYYGAGWWVYSFCYGESVRQFHALPPGRGVPAWPPTPDPSVYNFVLGRFKPGSASNKDITRGETNTPRDSDLSSELQTRGETNFLVQKLGEGTTCDLTGAERRVEIQYHCNPGSPERISMIKETASCVYLMVIHTPRLCNDVAFMPPQLDKPNPITCQEIVSREDESRWKTVKAAQVKDQLFGGKAPSKEGQGSERDKPVVVGGIQVGGQKLVGGSPERQIKVSNIGKPRKPEKEEEQFVVTLAESDGKKLTVLNEREIEKYDLKNPIEDIEEFIIKTENWAESFREGQPWRLDVVQTAEGIQFRGILIDDEQVEDEQKRQGEPEQDEQAGNGGSKEEYKKKEQP